MPRRSVRLAAPAYDLRETFAAIRADIGIPEAFPPDVLAEAERSAREPRLPGADLTDVPFVTLDPPESMDLDKAFHLERLPRPARIIEVRPRGEAPRRPEQQQATDFVGLEVVGCIALKRLEHTCQSAF